MNKITLPSKLWKKRCYYYLPAIILLSFQISSAQLSGTYTIGTGEDYETFAAACEDLELLGVAGPTVFNITSGTYNEQFTIPFVHTASETNTITFQSQTGNPEDVILQYNAEGDNDNYIMKIFQANYLTIKYMSFVALDDRYARPLVLENYAFNLTIEGCRFKGSYNTNGVDRCALISMSDGAIKDLNIINNRFSKGSFGVFISVSGNYNLRTHIESNTFDSLGYAAINLNKHEYTEIVNNRISYGTYAIRLYTSSSGIRIHSNLINHMSHTGLYLSNMKSAAGFESTVMNNSITINDYPNAGIEASSCSFIDFYHNTVLLTSDRNENAKVFDIKYCTNQTINLLNNNLVTLEKGYTIYSLEAGQIKNCDYNNYYTPGAYFAYWGEKCEDFRTFREVSGKDEHSIFAYPNFNSEEMPVPNSNWLDGAGTPIPSVTEDIDENLRDAAHPDIGAWEFTAGEETKPVMNGTYSIGTGGDFSSLNEAIQKIEVKGIDDTLILQFLPGYYEEQCIISPIPGASSTSPLILESSTGNSNDVLLWYNAENDDDNYILKLNGASFVHLRNLSLRAMDSRYARVIDMTGMVDSLAIHNCSLKGVVQANASDEAIIINGKDLNFHSLTMENDSIFNGSYAIMFNLTNSISEPGKFHFTNNYVESGYMNLYLRNIPSVLIKGNHFSSSHYGFYITYVKEFLNIEQNYIYSKYAGNIDLNQIEFENFDRARIVNNFLMSDYENAGKNALRLYNCDNFDIYYNSISMISDNNSRVPGNIQNSESANLKNNIFYNKGSAYSFYTKNSTYSTADYNCYYSQGLNLAYWDEDCSNLEALQTASGSNAHSIFANPAFVSLTDLHTSSVFLESAGSPVDGILKDIDGQTRNADTPDIGADEFGPEFNNPPVAVDDTIATAGVITIEVLENDYDPDEDDFEIVSFIYDGNGSVSIINNNTALEYNPGDSPDSKDTIQYVIEDDEGARDSAKVYISIYMVMEGFWDVGADIEGLSHGPVKWGDYDNDGDLDILQTGWTGTLNHYRSRIIENTGEGFVVSDVIMTGLSAGNSASATWIDFDHDKDLDIVISGRVDGDELTKRTLVYANTGGGFNEIQNHGLPNVSSSSIKAADFNNDGKCDLLITGSGDNEDKTVLYLNETQPYMSWSFTESEAVFKPMYFGEASPVDIDSDGDLDIFLCGAGIDPCLIYINDNGTFTEHETNIPGLYNASCSWGDFDNDGDPDLAIMGQANDSPLTNIYINNFNVNNSSNDWFMLHQGLTGRESGDIQWIDFDNDGDLDLSVTGNKEDYVTSTSLLVNEGGIFSVEYEDFPQLGRSALSWGDFDNDGDPDFVLQGINMQGAVTKIFRNDRSTPNEPPSVPGNLNATIEGEMINLSWDASEDDLTPQNSLRYNVRMGFSAGVYEVLCPLSSDHFLKTTEFTNAGYHTQLKVMKPSPGTYYWSVQAVDEGLSASDFSVEESISTTGLGYNQNEYLQVYPNPLTGDVLNIRNIGAGDIEIIITEVSGKTIWTEMIQNPDSSIEIEFALNQGIYFVRMQQGDTVVCRKIVK